MENKGFRFADKTEQLMRTNRFMVLAVTAYFVYIMVLLAISALRGERSMGFCGLIIAMVAITLIVSWVAYLRNKKSTKVRYIQLVGQCMIGWIIAFAYSHLHLVCDL